MRAVLFRKTGSTEGLVLTDVPAPSPQPHELLVRVHATSVTRGDVVLRKLPFLVARLFGIRRKTALGHEYAGQVEAVGEAVSDFTPGDRVFGTTTGLTVGSYAEYVCVPANGMVATLPEDVTYEEAAPVPIGALTALTFLRRGGMQAGNRVLINGASGSVGSCAVQLAAHLGAHVTGVASTRNIELVRALGAERVVDYTQADIAESGDTYDVVFDAIGSLSNGDRKRLLAEGGRFVSTRASTKESPDDLRYVRDLLGAGALRAVIDRRYRLDEIRDAHRYVEEGHKRGNVLVTVQ